MSPNSPNAARLGVATALLLNAAACLVADTNTLAFGFDDYLLAPVRIHLLASKDAPHITTTLEAADITRILGKINKVWSQAGLQFYLESLLKEEPQNAAHFPHPQLEEGFSWLVQLRPTASCASNLFHLYYMKQMRGNGVYLREGIFVKDTASLREVKGGIDEPIPRVSSHELGHALGLNHRQNVTNLMASGTTGTWLNAEEVSRVREKARTLPWIETASTTVKKADELHREGKVGDAKALYERVIGIPLNAEQVERAKKRVSQRD
jgi:hypothetical protein